MIAEIAMTILNGTLLLVILFVLYLVVMIAWALFNDWKWREWWK